MSDSYIALVEKSIDERTQQYQELLQLRDENEKLREENDKLREALKPFLIKHPPDVNVYGFNWLLVKPEHIRAAQDILEHGE